MSKFCRNCNKELEGTEKGRTYCSSSCKTIYWKKNHLYSEGTKVCVCHYCEKEFKSYHNLKYCSPQCRKKDAIKSNPGTCSWCGKVDFKYKLKKIKNSELSLCRKCLFLWNRTASYLEFANLIKDIENIRKLDHRDILEARCNYCGRWYLPNKYQILTRLSSEHNRLFCSKGCSDCYPETLQSVNREGTSDEVGFRTRYETFKRDNYKCVYCGSKVVLHCHKVIGDISNYITLCSSCHNKTHREGE